MEKQDILVFLIIALLISGFNSILTGVGLVMPLKELLKAEVTGTAGIPSSNIVGGTVKIGSLEVIKFTGNKADGEKFNPTGPDGEFKYTITGPTPAELTIKTINSLGVGMPLLLVEGKYTIKETLPEGWQPFSSEISPICLLSNSNGYIRDTGTKVDGTTIKDVEVLQGTVTRCDFLNIK